MNFFFNFFNFFKEKKKREKRILAVEVSCKHAKKRSKCNDDQEEKRKEEEEEERKKSRFESILICFCVLFLFQFCCN